MTENPETANATAPAQPAEQPPQPKERLAVVISPTIGRVVHLYNRVHQKEPEVALICAVNDDEEGTINVVAFDKDGHDWRCAKVPLLQEGDLMPAEGPWVEWMPYQRGQAPASSAMESRVKRLEDICLGLYSKLEAFGAVPPVSPPPQTPAEPPVLQPAAATESPDAAERADPGTGG